MSAPVFQHQSGSITCKLRHLHAVDSSDSPLVQHLLTSWQPPWRLSRCRSTYLHMYIQSLVGLESQIVFSACIFLCTKHKNASYPIGCVLRNKYMINFNSNVDVSTTANAMCERTSRLLRFGERKTLTSELFCSTFQPIVQTDTNWSILPIKFQ